MSFDRNYAGGSLTVQIPKDDVDTFLEAIRGTGYRITGINDSSRDVTSQYVDTEARIKVQEQKIENQRNATLASIYWGVCVVIYLLISFLTQAWHLTWIIWPVAGVAYGVVAAILKATRNS